jgi:general secretion pathway protein H
MTHQPGDKGYTLIELLAVIAILAVIAGFAVPMVERTIENTMLQSDARALMVELRSVQTEAITEQIPITVTTAEKGGLQLSSGATFTLPSGSSVRLADGTSHIDFLPDGTSNGGQLLVARGEDSAPIDVHWLSGDIEEPADQ